MTQRESRQDSDFYGALSFLLDFREICERISFVTYLSALLQNLTVMRNS